MKLRTEKAAGAASLERSYWDECFADCKECPLRFECYDYVEVRHV